MQIYNKLTKVADIITDDSLVPEGWTDIPPRWQEFEVWSDEAGDWIVDESLRLNGAKDNASNEVSKRSTKYRSAIIDDQTISNILIGATSGYPAYLQGETGRANVTAMIEQFKSIARQAKAAISAAQSKAEIDSILENLKFPTAEEILAQVQGV